MVKYTFIIKKCAFAITIKEDQSFAYVSNLYYKAAIAIITK